MIPLKEQQLLRLRFKEDIPNRVRLDFFNQKPTTVIVPGREPCIYCAEIRLVLEEVASLNDKISLMVHEYGENPALEEALGVEHAPCFVMRGQRDRAVRYYGLPTGMMYPPFIETLVDASRGATELLPETVRQLRRVKSDVRLQVLITTADAYSPAPARTALKLGLANSAIKVDIVEVAEFPQLMQRSKIVAVPTTVLNERVGFTGAMDEATMVAIVLQTVAGKPFTSQPFTGPSTPLPPPLTPEQQQQQQQELRRTPGGLVLPR